MTMRSGGGRSALLLAALLSAACMKTYEFNVSGGGGVGGNDAGPVGGSNGLPDGGGGNSDAGHLHCPGGTSAMSFNVIQEKPAFMFALDRSRSMLTGLGGNNGTRFSVSAAAINAIVSPGPTSYGALVPFGYYEFPTGQDPSCSNACCTAGFTASTGSSTQTQFMQWLNACTSSMSLTCNTSDSAPTYQALNKIVNSFRHNSSNTLYALLLTDGAPSNDCAFDPSPNAGNACEQTSNLIGDMFNGVLSPTPITTIVMAIGAVELDGPPSASMFIYNRCLNGMAFAGGHPAQTSQTAYILANTADSVHAQIDTIVSNAICQFDIDSSFDPNGKFEIDYNGSTITFDPMNGWTLDKTKLTFNGSLCTTLINAMRSSTHHNVSVKECFDPSHQFQQPSGP